MKQQTKKRVAITASIVVILPIIIGLFPVYFFTGLLIVLSIGFAWGLAGIFTSSDEDE